MVRPGVHDGRPGSNGLAVSAGDQPLISVQALIQSSKPLHLTSVRPSTHSAVGVRQYQTSCQKASSSAWKIVQWFGSTVRAQDLELPGASPKYSAMAAFVSGETRWSMNAYE